MNKVVPFLLGIMMLCQFTAEAALPPLAQTRRELLAILSDDQFSKSLSMGSAIQEIRRIEHGYLFMTQSEMMFVEVIPVQGNRIGPVEFELKFHPPEPLT